MTKKELKSTEFIDEIMIISGGIIEYKKYQNGYIKGGEGKNKNGRSGGSQEVTKEDKEENHRKVQQRSKTRLRRLINANVGQYGDITPKFLTLTFAQNITDLTMANQEWKLFIKKLNWYLFRSKANKLKYSVVVEFQKRGAVHYHVIFYNLPYVPNVKIREIWGLGFIRINKITEVDNIGAYVTKYMGKDISDVRLIGKKSNFSSSGLLEPMEITDKKMIEKLAGSLSTNLRYSVEYENDYLGQISYKQYNINVIQIKKEQKAV